MDMLNIVPGKRCENDLISLKIRAEEEGTAGGFRFLQFPNSVTGDEFILGNAQSNEVIDKIISYWGNVDVSHVFVVSIKEKIEKVSEGKQQIFLFILYALSISTFS